MQPFRHRPRVGPATSRPSSAAGSSIRHVGTAQRGPSSAARPGKAQPGPSYTAGSSTMLKEALPARSLLSQLRAGKEARPARAQPGPRPRNRSDESKRSSTAQQAMKELVGPVTETREDHMKRHDPPNESCPRCHWIQKGAELTKRFGKVPEGMRTPLTGNYWCMPRQPRRGGTWAIGCTVCALVNESHAPASTTRPNRAAKGKHYRRKLREFATKFARFEIRSIPQPSLLNRHARGQPHVRALRWLNRVVRKRKRKQLAADTYVSLASDDRKRKREQPRRGGTPAGVEEPVTTEGTHAGAEEPGKGDGYMYELRWALTGTPIKVCIGHGDVSVEELEQQLEEGYFEEYGVPRATDDNGDWALYFDAWHSQTLLWTVLLQRLQHTSAWCHDQCSQGAETITCSL